MTELAERFRTWVVTRAGELADSLEGLEVTCTDDEHVVIETPAARGEVNLYDVGGDNEIVEMRIAPPGDPDACTFFIHFELLDEERAHETFEEMLETLVEANQRTTTKVLLTCTSALTTTYFANKLNEAAAVLSLDFEFCAMAIERAIRHASEYAAVMVAPQAAYRVAELKEKNPDALIFEIPAKVFGSYDAGTALRMLLTAMSEDALAERIEESDAKIMRDLENDARILVLSIVGGLGSSTLHYRVYDHGEIVLDGRSVRRGNISIDYLGKDAQASLSVAGFDPKTLDAVGIAVTGAVENGRVRTVSPAALEQIEKEMGEDPCADVAVSLRALQRNAKDDIDEEFDLKSLVEEQIGVPTFVENCTKAAAVGCYVGQTDYESLVLYRQTTGVIVGSEGIIVDGRLVRGKGGVAGELSCLIRSAADAEQALDSSWTSPGMSRIVYDRLLEAIVASGPEAIFTSVDLLPDMEEVADKLRSRLPACFVPDLVPVTDFFERTLVGQYALCVSGLKEREREKKGKA